jgi:hypothetical protein
MLSTPKLMYQMALTRRRAFYYSQQGQEGDRRRDDLARQLFAIGLR